MPESFVLLADNGNPLPGLVYLLGAAISLASGLLLLRGAAKQGGGLLLWSSVCFFGMAVNNILMYVNFVVFVNVNLDIWPHVASLVSVMILNVALIWHAT
jgi:hypothetical protein